MAFDLVNFMDALARFIAAATSLNYATTSAPRAIWRNQAIDDGVQAASPFSVLRCYGGSLDWQPLPTPSIQVETIGANDAAMNQAMAIWGSLTDGSGRPLRYQELDMFSGVTKWRINGILRLGVPGLVGRDDKGRAKIVFNFDAEAQTLPLLD